MPLEIIDISSVVSIVVSIRRALVSMMPTYTFQTAWYSCSSSLEATFRPPTIAVHLVGDGTVWSSVGYWVHVVVANAARNFSPKSWGEKGL